MADKALLRAVVFLAILAIQTILSGQALPFSEEVWPSAQEIPDHDLWYFKNPWVEVDPNNASILYAYVSGELLKSWDSGASWRRIGKGLPANAVFNGAEILFPPPLAFSPFVEGQLLLKTSRQSTSGVPFRSDDAGETWHSMNICEYGPGFLRNNFKFSGTSTGVFSKTDRNTIFFPVVSERICQPVYVSLDGGRTIVPNPQCPFYKEQCKNPSLHNYCVDSTACFNYGGSYWGGDMMISVSPQADEMFEFDFHGALGYDYIARYKVLDRASGQLCTTSTVFVNLSTVPGYESAGEGYFKSPVFFTDDGKMYTVCDIVQTGTLNGNPVFQNVKRPFLAKCESPASGRRVFTFVSFLPEGSYSTVTDLKTFGPVIFLATADKELTRFRFLALSPHLGGTWLQFGDEGAANFSSVDSGDARSGIYYIASFEDPDGMCHTQLRVITPQTLDPVFINYRTETRFDFTDLNTGLSGFHVEDSGIVKKFWGRDYATFTGIDGLPRYALLRGAEMDIGKDPDSLVYYYGQENSAFFDEGFFNTAVMPACTSNFTSIAVREVLKPDQTKELWAYLSSDAGIWRNKKFHKPYDPGQPYELLEAFKPVSGGYKCDDGCPGKIPSADFGNYSWKVALDPRNTSETALYAACRSGLWKGVEQADESIYWSLVYDPPTKNGVDAGVKDVMISGCNVFILTAEGVLRSSDDTSWNIVYQQSSSAGPVTSIAAFADCPGKIVLAEGSSLYGSKLGGLRFSENDGASWRQVASLDPVRELPVKQMQCVLEGNLHKIYYLTADGALRKVLAYDGTKLNQLSLGIDSSAPCAVALSWKKDNSAVSYTIMRSEDGLAYELVSRILNNQQQSYLDLDAVGGRKYVYSFKADNPDSCLSYGSNVSTNVPSAFTASGASPSFGPRSGATAVEIAGADLGPGRAVSFGGILACSDCPYNPSTGTISAITPEIFECDYPYFADISISDACNETVLNDGFRFDLQMSIAPYSLPGGTVGAAYPGQQISASGGVSPYLYSLSAGLLPAGLYLSSVGMLSGTPTTAGNYGFTVRAIDECGFDVSASYQVDIGQSPGLEKPVFPQKKNN